MKENGNKRFNWRAFTSLYMTFSSILLMISGIILYIAPPGRIAHWSYLPILGLEKYQWQSLHTIFAFLFLIATGFHLYFNWPVFISYLKDKLKNVYMLRRELSFSGILFIVIVLLILAKIPPFSTIMDLGDSATDSWASPVNEPPIPHAEEMTIAQLAETIDQDVDKLLKRLENNGILATGQSIIADLAEQYDLAPQELYTKMQLVKNIPQLPVQKQMGYGKKTIGQLCQEEGIELDNALSRLKTAGIIVTADKTLREIAKEMDKRPVDIVNIIRGKSTDDEEHWK